MPPDTTVVVLTVVLLDLPPVVMAAVEGVEVEAADGLGVVVEVEVVKGVTVFEVLDEVLNAVVLMLVELGKGVELVIKEDGLGEVEEVEVELELELDLVLELAGAKPGLHCE